MSLLLLPSNISFEAFTNNATELSMHAATTHLLFTYLLRLLMQMIAPNVFEVLVFLSKAESQESCDAFSKSSGILTFACLRSLIIIHIICKQTYSIQCGAYHDDQDIASSIAHCHNTES